MKKYSKPMLQIVELEISEKIAAMVPKTIYRKNSGAASYSQGFSIFKKDNVKEDFGGSVALI